MIIVDIEVPSIESKYQFSVEEQVSVANLIAELVELSCQKEQCTLKGDLSEMCLCAGEQGRILNRGDSLARQGVANADWLLLV